MATSTYNIRALKDRIHKVNDIYDIAQLLAVNRNNIVLYSKNPKYYIYEIPKNNGKKRLIEDPHPPAKDILRKLNQYFQASYFYKRPASVYGFCISSTNEEERNIINNAKRHIGQPYMLNIDLKDFFHTVTQTKVERIIRHNFKNFNRELQQIVVDITCFKGRLPMGAPTSPVLSNFDCIPLDESLLQYAQHSGIKFTRFADDLCFSSQQPITKIDVEVIRDAIQKNGYIVNEEKVKHFDKNETKYVTGLVVGENEISLPLHYLPQLKSEIERLQHTMLVEQRFQTGMSNKKLKLFYQELLGKWNFANMVLNQSEELFQLRDQLENALHPPQNFESINWLEIPYNFE
jgi:RNA-directed DNA polymerase